MRALWCSIANKIRHTSKGFTIRITRLEEGSCLPATHAMIQPLRYLFLYLHGSTGVITGTGWYMMLTKLMSKRKQRGGGGRGWVLNLIFAKGIMNLERGGGCTACFLLKEIIKWSSPQHAPSWEYIFVVEENVKRAQQKNIKYVRVSTPLYFFHIETSNLSLLTSVGICLNIRHNSVVQTKFVL